MKMIKNYFIGLLTLFFISFSAKGQVNLIPVNDTVIIVRDQAPMAAAPILAQKWNQIHTKWFNLNFGMAFILDHNIVSQNDISLSQVGKVDPATEFRGERLMVTGNLLFFKHPWRYMISANFNGLDAAPGDKKFSFIDWNFEIPFGKNGGWITLGKQKEGVGHEYVAPGTQLMFMERGSGVPLIVRQRNIGIRYSNSILKQRATYTVGFFNNYWETGNSFSDNGSQITIRATALPIYTSDADLLHVGIGYRYTDATGGKLSYKAKPEVNTAPSYINTGSFNASAANTLMLEFIKVQGPVSFIAEYMSNRVKSVDANNPNFHYWQFGGDWFITGENRRYNRNNGNLGKLIPKKKFSFEKNGGAGAFELGARFTKSDLTDAGIAGGEFGRLTGALSWYPSASFRFSINYGTGSLNKGNTKGNSQFFQLRAQFEL
jgi:phosphate-selective porin OprO and OprP